MKTFAQDRSILPRRSFFASASAFLGGGFAASAAASALGTAPAGPPGEARPGPHTHTHTVPDLDVAALDLIQQVFQLWHLEKTTEDLIDSRMGRMTEDEDDRRIERRMMDSLERSTDEQRERVDAAEVRLRALMRGAGVAVLTVQGHTFADQSQDVEVYERHRKCLTIVKAPAGLVLTLD